MWLKNTLDMKILMAKKNIVLIGFMGCGKTTVGKELAKNLNFYFVDIDYMIQKRPK